MCVYRNIHGKLIYDPIPSIVISHPSIAMLQYQDLQNIKTVVLQKVYEIIIVANMYNSTNRRPTPFQPL